MLKRLIIAFPLLLALGLLQAHNLVTHHHESEFIPHHDHNNDENDHSPFNDLNHNADIGKIISAPQTLKDIIVEKPIFTYGLFIVLYNNLIAFESLPRYHPPDDDFSFRSNLLTGNIPLRAPPIFSNQS